jgi:hypothetical protein
MDNRLKALVATFDAICAAGVAFLITGDLRCCLLFVAITYGVNLLNQVVSFLPNDVEGLSSVLATIKSLWKRLAGG